MATYVAISTTNPQAGWAVFATGTNKLDVECDALDEIGPATDICAQTLLRNLTVLPISKARRFVNRCQLGEHTDRCSCF
jgi:hypothetical protein